MPLTLTLPQTPSQNGYSEKLSFRAKVAQFGDGYSQRVVDGINSTRKLVTLTLEFLTTSEKDDVEIFLRARGTWESFFYTLPSEASPRLWTLDGDFNITASQANLWNVSFNLKEEFDLA